MLISVDGATVTLSIKDYTYTCFRLNQFYKSLIDSTDAWKDWYDSNNPQDLPAPGPYQDISGLERLVILKCIRSDKVVPAIQVRHFRKIISYKKLLGLIDY